MDEGSLTTKPGSHPLRAFVLGETNKDSKRLTYATTSCEKYETGYFFETRSLPFFPGPARLESEGLVPAYRCFGRLKRSRELRVWWAPDTGLQHAELFLTTDYSGYDTANTIQNKEICCQWVLRKCES